MTYRRRNLRHRRADQLEPAPRCDRRQHLYRRHHDQRGTLQLGAGGTTGSIAGNITDNATLAFNRTATGTYAGVISGTGALTQAGTGTLVLNKRNTYSGGTTITAGTLQLGNGGIPAGSIAGNVTDNGTLAFDRSVMW